jgi:hypothetical protein
MKVDLISDQHDPLTDTKSNGIVERGARASDEEKLLNTAVDAWLLLGERISDVVLGVDLDSDNGLVKVDALTHLLEGAENMLVGRLQCSVLEHGDDTSVIHVHRSRRNGLGVATLQASLDASHPSDGAGGAHERDAGPVSELIGVIAGKVRESMKLTVVDARIHAPTELAGGGDDRSVDLDE